MKKSDFELILEDCLGKLEGGSSLEHILKDYPEHSAALEPLLRAASAAASLPKPDYQGSKEEGRRRLLAAAGRMAENGEFLKNGTKTANSRYSGQWLKNIGNLLFGKENEEMKLLPRLALYGVMTVLIAGFFTVNASASSLPGDALYAIKLGWEQAQLALTFSDDSRQELEFEFESERLDEVESLLGQGREEDVEFRGVLQEKGESAWVVSGITVAVDALTELKGALEIGALVKVEALTQADGSLLALEIYTEGAEEGDDIFDDSGDDLDDDSDDDINDDSNDDMDDDSDDDMDDDSDDDMSDDSADDMSDDSSDDSGDDSSAGSGDDKDDDSSNSGSGSSDDKDDDEEEDESDD